MKQPHAHKGVKPDKGATDAQESVEPGVVNAQPEPRASMEARRPQPEVTPADLAHQQGLSEVGQ